MGIGWLVFTVFVVFEVLVAMADLGNVVNLNDMADLGDVAVASSGWVASERGGRDGGVLTLGPWDLFPPRCWPSRCVTSGRRRLEWSLQDFGPRLPGIELLLIVML